MANPVDVLIYRNGSGDIEARDRTALGTSKWTHSPPGVPQGVHVDNANKVVYIAHNNGVEKLATSDGSTQWDVSFTPKVFGVVLVNGSLYISTDAGEVRKLDPADGSEITGGSYPVSIADSDHGVLGGSSANDEIYLGSTGGKGFGVTVINEGDGTVVWRDNDDWRFTGIRNVVRVGSYIVPVQGSRKAWYNASDGTFVADDSQTGGVAGAEPDADEVWGVDDSGNLVVWDITDGTVKRDHTGGSQTNLNINGSHKAQLSQSGDHAVFENGGGDVIQLNYTTLDEEAFSSDPSADGQFFRATRTGGDTTAPTLTNATASADQDGYTWSADTDEGNGMHYLVVDQSSTVPTKTQVKNGNGADGNAADATETTAVSNAGTISGGQTGVLAEGTTYHVYSMHEDDAGNQSSVADHGSFTTATSSVELRVPIEGVTSLTGLEYAVIAEPLPSNFATVETSGANGEISNGDFVLDVSGTTLSQGDIVFLVLSDTDGDLAGRDTENIAAGPVEVTQTW